jgi:hypothetical protein
VGCLVPRAQIRDPKVDSAKKRWGVDCTLKDSQCKGGIGQSEVTSNRREESKGGPYLGGRLGSPFWVAVANGPAEVVDDNVEVMNVLGRDGVPDHGGVEHF